MATATINNTAWADVHASPCENQLKVWPLSLARPRGVFLGAGLTLLAVPLLQTAWGGHSLGAIVLIAACALFFHINNLDRSIVTSKSSRFWIDLSGSVLVGGSVSALLFYAFPGLVPRVDIVLSAGLLICLLPVVLRLFLQRLINRGKFVEEILIVGTGDLPAKLHRALGRSLSHSRRHTQMRKPSGNLAGRVVAIDLAELNELVARDQISRVVIADLDAQSRERLAGALLDSRLRGLQVNDAVEFYEEFSEKIWVEALNPQWFVYTPGFNLSQAGLCLERC